MLTANEREWLTVQRERLIRADVEAAAAARDWLAVAVFVDEPGWGARRARARRRAELGRLAGLRQLWREEALRLSAVINSWVAVHRTLAGQDRGPVRLPPVRSPQPPDPLDFRSNLRRGHDRQDNPRVVPRGS